MNIPFTQSLLVALLVGLASGSIGAFIILKRMALVGDALSHVALPGIALALMIQIDPFWGVILSLLLAAVLIWKLEMQTKLPSEALVGLLFTTSLAVGILIIPDIEIVESLFGGFTLLSHQTLFVVLTTATIATLYSFLLARNFLFNIVSPENAQLEGPRHLYDLALFLLFATIVALGIKLVGTLLMGALTIIPASAAKNISRGMKGYIILSTILGGVISIGGTLLAHYLHFLPGPTIILLGIGMFLLSLLWTRK